MKEIERRLEKLAASVGRAAGVPPLAIEDEGGLLRVDGHEPMTTEQYVELVKPWADAGIPAIIIKQKEAEK